jgi:hypothetical protein
MGASFFTTIINNFDFIKSLLISLTVSCVKLSCRRQVWFGHTAVAYKIEDDFFKGWNCLEFAPLC